MRSRPTLRRLALAAAGTLFASLAWAEEAKRVVPTEPDAAVLLASRLAQARARIAELEARVAEMQVALAGKDAARAAAQLEAVYDINPNGEAYRFLDLGVRREYVAAERDRLIDQLHTMIPPIYEPAFSPFHGYTLPPRSFRVGLGTDRFVNNHDFGRDEVYSRFFDDIKVENQHVELDLSYGLDHNDTLRLSVPLRSTIISGTGKAFRIKPMVMTMNGQGFGIGDLHLVLKRKWLDQAYAPLNLATVVGVQLPTGRHDRRFNDAQTIFMNGMAIPVSAAAGGPKVDLFSDDQRIPNSAQPGTGSWGAVLGVMGTRQLTWNRVRGAIHAGVLYKAMAENDDGVRPGNELVFAVSFVRPPLPGERLTFDLTLFGRNKQAERFPGLITHPEADANGMPIMNPDGSLKMFTTPRPPFEHGTVVFLSPSLVYIPKPSLRLTASPTFRIHEPFQGPSPAFRLFFGATTTF